MAENGCTYNFNNLSITEAERISLMKHCGNVECSGGCLNIMKELLKERKRVIQWRILNEATVILNSRLHSESLPLKFIKCAKKLVSAREAMLALREETGTGLKIIKHYTSNESYNQFEVEQKAEPREKLIEERAPTPQGAIKIILEKGEIIERNSAHFCADDLFGFTKVKKNLLGVPLLAHRKIIGALLAANKDAEGSFTEDDRELLIILGSQLGIALENSRLYEKIDEKLQLKVDELQRLNEKLLKQQKILEKSSEIHKKLTELVLGGRGIEAICSTLANFIVCPVQIEDHNFDIKATTVQNGTDTPFFSGKDLIHDSSFSRQARDLFQERKPVEIVLGTGEIQYLVPIVAGEQILGLLTAVLVEKTLKLLDRAAMERGATVTALAMLKERAAVEQTKRLKENFVEQVLEGDFASEDWVHHRALQLGFNLEDSYQVVVVEVDPGQKDKGKSELYQKIRDFCMHSFPDVVVVTKSSHLLLMVTSDRNKKQQDAARYLAGVLKERLSGLVRGGRWWIALGTSCAKLESCVLSYRNAVSTLGIMKSLKLKNKAVCYDHLGIFSLIEINPQRFTEFTQKALGPLVEYDQKHKSQLVSTLNLYYKYNGNVLKASREGYLNPSTMKYRLRRIKEITGLDFKDAEVGLQLQLAIKLLNYDCPDA